MHDSDADDFHGKDSGCDRCSEKSRKGSTHAAHDHNVAVFFFTKSQIFTKGISDTATQRRAAPSRPAEPPTKWVKMVLI